jgi:hypothetical protein
MSMSGDRNLKFSDTIEWAALASHLFVLSECYARGTCNDSIAESTSVADTTTPTIVITNVAGTAVSPPSFNATGTVSTTPITITGTANDNVAIANVTWVNDRGGNGTASGTTSWSATGIALQTGANVITFTAHDTSGLIETAQATVTLSGGSGDTTAPTILINNIAGTTVSPAAVSASLTVSSTPITLAGTSNDNIGVTSVTVACSPACGTPVVTGTTTWSITGIALTVGTNTITVTARDAAGNAAQPRPV